MNRLLITGASGFIGTNLIEYLKEKYIICNVDIQKPKMQSQYAYWRNIDITNFDRFKEETIKFKPDFIIHLAARTDLDGETIEDYAANTRGVENLLKIVESLPKLKKVIIASSMLVCHTGYLPKNQFDYAPTTMYGKSKVLTEKLVWENRPHCDWAIIRTTSIWGPWFGEPYRRFFDMIISRRYFHIGDKECTKTYGYVGNTVYQIEKMMMANTNGSNKVYYIGDEPAVNIKEWSNEIAEELGIKIMKMPYSLISIAARVGDVLKKMGINFPMTSFRLKNMTTNNIVDLTNTQLLAANPPYYRIEGVKETLQWLTSTKN